MFEYFYSKITTIIKTSVEVTYKVFKKKIGFGFISENNRYFKSRILRLEKSMFYDIKQASLLSSLTGHHGYSEVFNIWQTNPIYVEGKTVFIFRHFLKWDSLSEYQKKSISVATIVSVDGVDKIEFIHPSFIDEEYVLIEKTDSTWFWVVSNLGNLPTRMKSRFQSSSSVSLSCSMSLRGLSLFQKLVLGSFSFDM